MSAPTTERSFKGIPASTGVVHGVAFALAQEEVAVPSYQITPEQLGGEITRFEQAILETRHQLMGLRGELAKRLGESEATIFDAHLLVLEDRALIEETIRQLRDSGMNIERAFYEVAGKYIEAFSRIEDAFIQERMSDIKDVARRIIHNLLGKNLPLTYHMATPAVLVAKDLTPSEAAILEPNKVLAVVTEQGGRTSHASIIARALGVPAVVGARGILELVKSGQPILVDGGTGEVVLSPTLETLKAHGRGNGHWEERRNRWKQNTQLSATTTDGANIAVWANLESVEEARVALEMGAEGVGLFRTEFLFLKQERFPSEEEQLDAYRKLAEAFKGKPVTIRTLDLGGDKKLGKYFERTEKNPFMGYRAIRFCLENRELFKTQLRALLRASVYGSVRIMFPMISGASEFLEAIGVLDEAKRELDGKGIAYDKAVQIGSMIEVPSAALTVDLIAPHCQFISIGTNDLIQYLLACDRVNDRIAYLYEPSHPAVVRLIKQIVEVAAVHKVEVSLCGEVASDGLYLPMLVGLGVRKLSLAPRAIPEIKHLARNLKAADAEAFLKMAIADAKVDLLGDLRERYSELAGK